jgi:aminoglycoside phosphotransferase (APT) family kinase protein
MFEEIENYQQWRIVEKINKGWSDDAKYYIETVEHKKLLLRISDRDHYALKKKEFEMMLKCSGLGFKMSEPISFGICNKDQNVYILLTWIEGEDLEFALPNLEQDAQYALGREAGCILKRIHSIKVSDEQIPTHTKILKKKKQLQKYLESDVRISGDEAVLKFINDNLDAIWSKPPVYLHGDFHPGNLILTPSGEIGVIDFNRWEIGDPYEEFYKLEIFSAEISIPFCRGQIDAYFGDNGPSEDFWKILAVYVAHASLYSIKWAERFGQKDIDNMVELCKKSWAHYDNFKNCIPGWYR